MKKFNTTGVCISDIHYMVDIDEKLNKIENMIDCGEYFVINRPRQYGKTTTMHLLEKTLKEKYTIISVSFEELGDANFKNEENFCKTLCKMIIKDLRFKDKNLSSTFKEISKNTENLYDLSEIITELVEENDKEIILLIDEVDKSSNNQLFLSFLGILRSKYLLKMQNKDFTFKSVILAGVHDIKNLKLKIRNDEEIKYNSPWNIAVNFDLDMSFSVLEIKTMLDEYFNDIYFDTFEISELIYYFTNGYPFLVSRICQIIDEQITKNTKRIWTQKDLQQSIKILLKEKNTLFDDLIKNIENNKNLYESIYNIVINGKKISFNMSNPLIDLGCTFGIFRDDDGLIKINNKIFEQYIYDYFVSKIELENNNMDMYNHKNNFIENNNLNIEKVINRFQQFMKEQYSTLDSKFIEREGRLLFLAFIKPIINGVGFDFKEVQISEEKRLDVVITYNDKKYIVELKIWRGQSYHNDGINQLSDYLDINGLSKGYMVVFNFNKNKEYKQEVQNIKDKTILVSFV